MESERLQATDNIPIPPTPGKYFSISIDDFRAVSPLNISKTTDLALGYDNQELMVYIIKRADGSYEKYLFPINYIGNKRANMNLETGDVVVVSAPLVPLQSTPMLDKPPSENSENQRTAIPYPVPLLDPSKNPNPYP